MNAKRQMCTQNTALEENEATTRSHDKAECRSLPWRRPLIVMTVGGIDYHRNTLFPELDPSGQGAPFLPRRVLENNIDVQIREDLSESLTLKVLDCRL